LNTPFFKISKINKTFSIKNTGFFKKNQPLHALQNINLEIKKGEVLGLVGESGSGKSTLAKILVGLLKPNSGNFSFGEFHSDQMSTSDWQNYRSKVTMVFQDPYSSLNPRLSVEQILSEPLVIHRDKLHSSGIDKGKTINQILDSVGLPAAAINRFPHEFSGGQRQRIGIARALILRPELIILDEPISALDVSIQAQIINLLIDLKEEYKLSYLFIAHDLEVVAHLSQMIAVLYLGKIMETGTVETVFNNPRHPYTRALLESVPALGSNSTFKPIQGEIPSPINPPTGCYFHPRCQLKKDLCSQEAPTPGKSEDNVHCHFPLNSKEVAEHM
jgi:oligopeptide/dipeptide ABC transporter ATP-binding protein